MPWYIRALTSVPTEKSPFPRNTKQHIKQNFILLFQLYSVILGLLAIEKIKIVCIMIRN